jgi:hypothetical protein
VTNLYLRTMVHLALLYPTGHFFTHTLLSHNGKNKLVCAIKKCASERRRFASATVALITYAHSLSAYPSRQQSAGRSPPQSVRLFTIQSTQLRLLGAECTRGVLRALRICKNLFSRGNVFVPFFIYTPRHICATGLSVCVRKLKCATQCVNKALFF